MYCTSTQQEKGKAAIQFASVWRNLRECINDIFSPESDDMPTQQQRAVINEFMSVWTGQKALSQASAQLRLNWGIIRSCIDRFTNLNEPSVAPNQANINWWPFGEQ